MIGLGFYLSLLLFGSELDLDVGLRRSTIPKRSSTNDFSPGSISILSLVVGLIVSYGFSGSSVFINRALILLFPRIRSMYSPTGKGGFVSGSRNCLVLSERFSILVGSTGFEPVASTMST